MTGLRFLLSKRWSIMRAGKVIYERERGFSEPENIGTMLPGSTWVLHYSLRLEKSMYLHGGDTINTQLQLTSSAASRPVSDLRKTVTVSMTAQDAQAWHSKWHLLTTEPDGIQVILFMHCDGYPCREWTPEERSRVPER